MSAVVRGFMTATLLWIAALVFASGADGQQSSITYLRAGPQIVQSRLSPVPGTQHGRIERMRQQFRSANVYGPVEVTEQRLPGQSETNLICTLRGTAASTILVAVDTSHKASSDEAQVDWATLQMLPLLVESLVASPSHNTLQFVAFNSSSGKHSGVSFYLAQMRKTDRNKIAAVIELDHLGRTPAAYAPLTGSHTLGKRLQTVAWQMKYHVPGLYLDEHTGEAVGTGPIARSFEHARIPAITIYSRDHSDLLQLTLNGSPTYVQKLNVDPTAYYETYLLLCAYLRQVDQDLSR